MRKLISLFFLIGLGFFSAPHSFAHVEITSSFPEQYTNATPIPEQVWIEFSGDLQELEYEILNTIEVVDSTGIAVNFDDPIIVGPRITTKISDQSAPGVFLVKYRVVGQDGHVIEGDYTFSASPDYSVAPVEKPLETKEEGSKIYIGVIVFGAMFFSLVLGYLIYRKKDRK